MLTVRHPKLNP